MQGAQNLRSEAYLAVRCNDEGEAQRRRWTFYEAIKFCTGSKEVCQGVSLSTPMDMVEWAKAPPALRAAVTKMASAISCFVAPAFLAAFT